MILKFQLLATIHVQIKSDSAVSISLPCPLIPPPPWWSMGIWLSSMPQVWEVWTLPGWVGNLNLWNTFLWFNFKHGGFSRKGVHFHKQIFTSENDAYKQRTQQQGKKLNLLKFYRIRWSHKELFKEKIVLELIGNLNPIFTMGKEGGIIWMNQSSKVQMLKGLLRGWMLKLLIAQCIMVLAHITLVWKQAKGQSL